jgi:2-methylisocitrate lyase-like PEP mutase family enzyme
MVVGGKTPLVGISQAEDLGYRVMIMPGILLRSAIATFDSVLASIRQTGRIPVPETAPDVAQGFRRFGADKWDEIRNRYAAPSGDASGS